MDVFSSIGAAVFVSIFGLVVLTALTGVRRSWEIDPTGSRARALYLYGVAFASLVLAVFAVAGVAAAVVRILLPSHVPTLPGGFVGAEGFGGGDDQFTNQAVLGGIVAVAALVVFLFHYRRIEGMLREPGWLEGPGARIRRGYLYLASFVWIGVALFAGIGAAFAVYQIIAPGTAGLGAPTDTVRDAGIVTLVSLGILTVLALLVFRVHWRRISGLGVRGDGAAEPSASPAGPGAATLGPAPHPHAPPPAPPGTAPHP